MQQVHNSLRKSVWNNSIWKDIACFEYFEEKKQKYEYFDRNNNRSRQAAQSIYK